MNRRAMAKMIAPVDLVIVPGASHLFEEPGTLEHVASLVRDFCLQHLGGASTNQALKPSSPRVRESY
jgi:hypothetical protein